MMPVFAVADDSSVSARDFSRRFADGMGMEPPDLSDDELEVRVSRLRALRPPWGIGLRPEQGLPKATLLSNKSMMGQFFSTSSIAVHSSGQTYEVEFRGNEKAHHVHQVILWHITT